MKFVFFAKPTINDAKAFGQIVALQQFWLVIWRISMNKSWTFGSDYFLFIPYGHWERINKTKMTGNGLRIFLDPGSGPFRFTELQNLGNPLKCPKFPNLGMTSTVPIDPLRRMCCAKSPSHPSPPQNYSLID